MVGLQAQAVFGVYLPMHRIGQMPGAKLTKPKIGLTINQPDAKST